MVGSRFELATPTVLFDTLYFCCSSCLSHALYQARHFSCPLLTSILFFPPSSPPNLSPSCYLPLPSLLPPFLSLAFLHLSQVPGTGGGRRVGWWSTSTGRVFSLHLKPVACQQNMYTCSTDSTFNRSDSRHVHACTVYGIKGLNLEVGRGRIS